MTGYVHANVAAMSCLQALNPSKIIRIPPLVSISLYYITFDVFKYPQHKFILAEQQQQQEIFYIGMKTTI